MEFSRLDSPMRPLAQRLHANHMARFGIETTMAMAGAYNRLKHGRTDFAGLVVPQKSYRTHPGDSRLRKLILSRESLTKPR